MAKFYATQIRMGPHDAGTSSCRLAGKNGGFAVNHVSASTLQGVLFSLHKNEVHSMGKSIFDGRVQIKYSYGCYGMTRGGGKTCMHDCP